MNWYLRSLLKFAGPVVDQWRPSRKTRQQSPTIPYFQTLQEPQQPTYNNPPQGYDEIGDAGSEEHDPDNECAVFAWAVTPQGFQFEEAIDSGQTHDDIFPGINRTSAYFGRFSQCSGRASLAVPSRRTSVPTNKILVQQVVNAFKRFGLREIWEFRDGTDPTLIWRG